MHTKQREQTQLAREEEEWQENRKREQEAKAQQYEKTVAHLKDLESKLAVRRQWENEDPRQHGGIILDSVGITAAAYNAQGMLSAVMLNAGNSHDTRTASPADSLERPRTTVGVMLVDNMIDDLVVGGPAYNSRALREGDYIVGVDALQVDAQDLPCGV
jgi:C-terminal processing protease CtpA/Prc